MAAGTGATRSEAAYRVLPANCAGRYGIRPFARAAIIAAYFGVACATINDRPTAPTSVEPSSGGASEAHPSTPQPNPPAADRGTPPPPRPSPPAAEDYDATKAQWAVGEPESGELLERARVAAQAKSARFLRPNQIITTYIVTRWKTSTGRCSPLWPGDYADVSEKIVSRKPLGSLTSKARLFHSVS